MTIKLKITIIMINGELKDEYCLKDNNTSNLIKIEPK